MDDNTCAILGGILKANMTERIQIEGFHDGDRTEWVVDVVTVDGDGHARGERLQDVIFEAVQQVGAGG